MGVEHWIFGAVWLAICVSFLVAKHRREAREDDAFISALFGDEEENDD